MPRVGDRIGNYEITGRIGRGAMATVFRAHDERLDRDVALKLLDPGYSLDFIFRARFEREYRVTAQLRNDHIIPVYDAGQWDEQLYIAMMLVEGPNLADVMKAEGPLELARVVSIVADLAEALDEAHSHRVVHRDVKPANILLARHGSHGSEHAYLADFGLTLGMEGTHLTRTGGFMGTLTYASPEQLNSGAIDGRADEYSLAATCYHMLVGAPPFKRENEMALINAHLFDPVPRANAVRPDLPPRVASVIARGMAKLPERRYPTATDFARALAAASGVALVTAASRRRRDLRRLTAAAAVIGLILVGALGGAAAVAILSNNTNAAPASAVPTASRPVAIADPTHSPTDSPTDSRTDSPTDSAPTLPPPPPPSTSPVATPTTTPSRSPRPTRRPTPSPPPASLPLVAEGTWSVVNSPSGTTGDPYVVIAEHGRRYLVESRCTAEDDCHLAVDTFDADSGEQLGSITFRWNGKSYVFSGPVRWYNRAGGNTCETSAGEIVQDAYTTREQVSIAPRMTDGPAVGMTGTKTISGTPTAAGVAAGCAPYEMTYDVAMNFVA